MTRLHTTPIIPAKAGAIGEVMGSRLVIERFESPGAAAREAAIAIADALREAVLGHGRATFIATGGRTPGPVYDLLARAGLPWEKIAVTLTDERWVDPHSPDSNERLVRERLDPSNFIPLKTADPVPERADARLAAILPADVVLLGMGEDGHVASLFPGGPAEEGLSIAVSGRELPRLSLTTKALAANRLTVLLVSGEAKRQVLKADNGMPVHRLLAAAKAPVRILWSP